MGGAGAGGGRETLKADMDDAVVHHNTPALDHTDLLGRGGRVHGYRQRLPTVVVR